MDCKIQHSFCRHLRLFGEVSSFYASGTSAGIQLLTVFLLALLVVPSISSAQIYKNENAQIPTAEFGQVPDSLLQMESYNPAPSAPYLYAYKNVNITFEEEEESIVAILNYHVRIKVFDEDAKQASIIAIPYYFQDDVESVDQIRGYTYQPDGSRTSLQPENIRTINLNTRYNVKEFNMPGVAEGSVIEYSYRKKRRFIEELPDFHLAHQVPTAVAKATVEYPVIYATRLFRWISMGKFAIWSSALIPARFRRCFPFPSPSR
ncbi:MAG: DUF3857 domain-containing protein [Balneolaceae bacterium]|nr:DUF3857 domain-containing protein [Balneolaceae bacterium]